MPAFAAAYGMGDWGYGRRAAADEIVMILPAFRSFMPGRILLIVRNVAVTLPSIEVRQPSSEISSSGPGGVKLPPAFATRISIGPNFFSTLARKSSISANLVTSAVMWIALPPLLS